MPKRINLELQKFGRLTVVKLAYRKNYKGYWLLICQCGKTKIARTDHLKTGRTTSCGCWNSEKSKKDLIGKRFGRWTVLSESGKTYYKALRWLCKCDCGNTKVVTGNSLRNGASTSCGCLHSEISSQIIKKVATTHGLSKTKEYKRAKSFNRRAKEKNSKGSISEKQIQELFLKQRGRCAGCNKKIKYNSIHRDHIMPLMLGGTNDIGNIQILCVKCNLTKSAKHPIKWAMENGKLC